MSTTNVTHITIPINHGQVEQAIQALGYLRQDVHEVLITQTEVRVGVYVRDKNGEVLRLSSDQPATRYYVHRISDEGWTA